MPIATGALPIEGDTRRISPTRSRSMSVMVNRGNGSLDMMPGISLDTSDGEEKPRCFLQGSFLRVLPAIHRRNISFAQMPTARGDDGVHSGSDRSSLC